MTSTTLLKVIRAETLTSQTDDPFRIHVTALFTYTNRRRDQSPRDCDVHVIERNCLHGNTQRISHRNHHRSLEISSGSISTIGRSTRACLDSCRRKLATATDLALDVSWSEHRASDGSFVCCCPLGAKASRSTLTDIQFRCSSVSLKTTDASRDVHRSHDAPLPSVPTRDGRRSRVGVSAAIR